MERVERVGAKRKPFPHLELGRQRVGEVAGVFERSAHEVAHALLRDVLGGRIDRREVGGCDGVAEVVGADVEAVTSRPPAQPDARPGLQLAGEPRLVEPRRGDLGAAVVDACRQDLQATPPPLGDAQHLADHDRLLLGREL